MPLANGVVVVYGRRRSALYDLHGGRIQRLPTDFARVLDQDPVAPASSRDAEIFQYLISAGFYKKDTPPFHQPFSVDQRYPLVPRFHTVSADMGAFKKAIFVSWLEEGLLHGMVRHLVIYDRRSITAGGCEVLAAFCAKWRVSGKYACFGDGHVRLMLINDLGEIINSERLPYRRSKLKLVTGVAQYSMLTKTSELAGQLHVDHELSIWPDAYERHHRYGAVDEGNLASLTSTNEFLQAFTNIKGKRQICSECELRHCCFYPFSLRRSSSDIASAPLDCGYDPLSPSWQNQLLAESAV